MPGSRLRLRCSSGTRSAGRLVNSQIHYTLATINVFVLLAGMVSSAAATSDIHSLSLEQVIERAVERSNTLHFEQREVEILSQQSLLEWRNYLPELSLSFAADTAVTPVAADNRSRRVSAGLRQTVYDGGRASRARSVQAAETILRRFDLEKLERSVQHEAWSAAVQYQIALEREEVIETAAQIATRQSRITRHRFEQGEITEPVYVDAMLSVAELDHELQAARIDTEHARLQLNRLLEMSADERVEITDGFSAEQLPEPIRLTERQLLRSAERQSTDLRRQEIRLYRARQEAAERARRYIPQVSLRLNASLAADTLPLRHPQIMFGIDLSWQGNTPVSSSLTGAADADGQVRRSSELSIEPLQSVAANVEAAALHLEADRAAEENNSFREELRFSVARALSLLELSTERWDSSIARRDLLQRRLEIVEAQAELGQVVALTVLDAVRDLLESELELLEAARTVFEHRRVIEELTGIQEGSL